MKNKLLQIQKNEITEYALYKKIAPVLTDTREREIVLRMAEQEKAHYEIWKKITGKKMRPSLIKVWFYYFICC